MPFLKEVIPPVGVGDFVGKVEMVRMDNGTIINQPIPFDTPGFQPEVTVFKVLGIGNPVKGNFAHKVEVFTSRRLPKGFQTTFPLGADSFFSVDPQAEEVDPLKAELAAAGYKVKIIRRDRSKSGSRLAEPKFSVRVEKRERQGERVYINKEAFADLATQSKEAAERIYGTLMGVNIVKTTHSQLEEAIMLGTFPKERFDRFFLFLEGEVHSRLTELLQDIVYKPTDPDEFRKRSVLRVVGTDKRILGSCYDHTIDAFTFATGEEATNDMFWEMGAIPREDPLLTNIGRGKSGEVALLFLDREKGVGGDKVKKGTRTNNVGVDGKKQYSFKIRDQGEPIGDDEIDKIKDRARNKVLNETAKIISDAYGWNPNNDKHRAFLMRLFSSFFAVSLHTTIFANQTEIKDAAKARVMIKEAKISDDTKLLTAIKEAKTLNDAKRDAATQEAAERLTEYVFSRHTRGIYHSPAVEVPDMPRLNDDLVREVEDIKLDRKLAENMVFEGVLYTQAG